VPVKASGGEQDGQGSYLLAQAVIYRDYRAYGVDKTPRSSAEKKARAVLFTNPLPTQVFMA